MLTVWHFLAMHGWPRWAVAVRNILVLTWAISWWLHRRHQRERETRAMEANYHAARARKLKNMEERP